MDFEVEVVLLALLNVLEESNDLRLGVVRVLVIRKQIKHHQLTLKITNGVGSCRVVDSVLSLKELLLLLFDKGDWSFVEPLLNPLVHSFEGLLVLFLFEWVGDHSLSLFDVDSKFG